MYMTCPPLQSLQDRQQVGSQVLRGCPMRRCAGMDGSKTLPAAKPRDISYVARHTGDYCGPRRPDGGTWMNAEHSPFLLLLFVHTLSNKYKKNESSSS